MYVYDVYVCVCVYIYMDTHICKYLHIQHKHVSTLSANCAFDIDVGERIRQHENRHINSVR